MAVTAHSDPYGIFMRKIGYSVGLERTLERFGNLEDMYLENRDVTLASWNQLVGPDTGWQLKTDNIADVFHSLDLIHRTTGDVLVLANLDAAAIASRILDDERQSEAARKFIFLWAVLVNDGEIFVNLLLAGFEEGLIKEKLSAMIDHKRQIIASAIPGKDTKKRIARVVTIERQEKNRGSTGAGKSVSSLRRTEPLPKYRRSASESSIQEVVEFSGDYFRKVPPRRKEWAKSLGLWSDDSGLTARGKNFIEALELSGYIGADRFFTFWPMDFELTRSGFKPNLINGTKTLWQTLVDFGVAFSDLKVKPFENSDTDSLVENLEEMMNIYRSLHTRKSMLRRELAITIAFPSIVAVGYARRQKLIDLPKALDAERAGDKRRIILRRSRKSGGALSVKR